VPAVVAAGSVHPVAVELLRPFGELAVAPSDDEEGLRPLLPDAVALIARGATEVTAPLLDAAPALRVIGRSGVGVERIDLAAATARGLPVVVTPGAGAPAVAEGALAMMLCLAKRLRPLDAVVREGRWAERDEVEVGDLEGATLGVVGLGRIGSHLAGLARALGMEVVGHDPYAPPGGGIELLPLPALVERAGLISLHAPLTPETEGMVDGPLLERAGPGAILVNLGRGGLVRSPDDLLAALDAGTLAGVGLDVFSPEPPDVSHPLFRDPRVLLSPHTLGMSSRGRERVFRAMAEGMALALRGQRAPHVANPAVYDAPGA
jgi:D-3-phosphoglycerate dehydrogenase / 2-oxoglutarate reductase